MDVICANNGVLKVVQTAAFAGIGVTANIVENAEKAARVVLAATAATVTTPTAATMKTGEKMSRDDRDLKLAVVKKVSRVRM